MKKALWVGLLSCVACAGGSEDAKPPAERLQGQWVLESPTNAACGLSWEFFDDKTYEFDASCLMESGSIGVQSELGTYVARETRVTLTPTHESCPTTNTDIADVAFDFLDDGRLRLVTPDGAIVFAPYDGPSKNVDTSKAGAVIEFGCWMNDNFTPHTLEKL